MCLGLVKPWVLEQILCPERMAKEVESIMQKWNNELKKGYLARWLGSGPEIPLCEKLSETLIAKEKLNLCYNLTDSLALA